MVTIVDYGMGNLGSIRNMFKKVGVETRVASTGPELESATKILLPGVGAFDAAMKAIAERGLRATLDRKVLEEEVLVLGVCLGMQLFLDSSEEGKFPGLGWIPGRVVRFPCDKDLKVPHMGWNTVEIVTPTPLTSGFEEMDEVRFYFVHSYCAKVEDPAHSLFRTEYGLVFDAGVHRGNIIGVQFHPEKSHKFGMKLFRNFGAM